MIPRRQYVVTLLLVVACNFDEDRSLGHIDATNPPDTGGTIAGTNSSTSRGGNGAYTVDRGGAATTIGGGSGAPLASCTPTDTSACAATQYCAFDMDCGQVTPGTCRDRPLECEPPNTRQTVCGCDRKYHASVCEAERTGVAIAPLSECTTVECDVELDCARFEESCPFYYGAEFPDARCSANHTCVCESAIIL